MVRAQLRDLFPRGARQRATQIITTTLAAVGKGFSQSPRTNAQIKAHADAVADMFCAYLESLLRA